MDTASAIQAFSETNHTLPVEALRWTLDHWEEAFPELLARLEALPAGIEVDDAEADIPFYFLHLCGDKAETRVFPALCRLMMTAEPIRRMLDDAITTTLSGILISTFGGDTAPLKAVIEAPEADEYVRHTGMMALAYLARTGSVPEAEMRAYLPHLFETMQPRTENYVWVGWADAIAGLGYADMRPMVEAAFDDERIGSGITEIKHFDADLRAALDDPTSMKAFEADRIAPHTDTIEELSHWHGFSQEAKLASEQAAKKPATPFKPVTLEQRAAAVRQVGRNDPCPCGSGKKYKKCCLMAA